ncbi:MAG: ABC transporter substrate-binding protein [Solirubrobacterales bacterium]
MHRRRPTLFLPLIALLVAVFLASCGGGEETSTTPSEPAEPLTLGSVFSTTGIGAPFGPQQVAGANLAAEQVNEDGGIDGAEITIEQIDDASEPKRSARAMKTLASKEDAVAILGPTFSNSAAEADPVANELGVPVLAVSNTGPGIVGECPYPCELVFRDSLGEATAIPANIENFAGSEEAEKATVIYPLDDPFADTSSLIAARAFEDNKIAVTGREAFAPLEAGPQPAIEEAIEHKADAIFIAASSGEVAVSAIEIARELGFEGEILGGNAFNSTVAAKEAGADGVGARSAAAWYAGNESETNASFIEAYRDAYDAEPDQFAAQAYTGVLLLAEAAQNADLSGDLAADREALAAALAEVEVDTPLGEFAFTADHDVVQPIWVVEMDGDGGYELIEEVPPEVPE